MENSAILRQIKTMPRLKGFDYKRPFFYMVTIKALEGVLPFSRIRSADGTAEDKTWTTNPSVAIDSLGRQKFLEATEITFAFEKIIREFHTRFKGLSPIDTFIIMPDHLHLLLKIEETGDQFALGKYVYQLEKALAAKYWEVCGPSLVQGVPSPGKIAPIFAPDWHDWIVKKRGQLAAFTRYIRENPYRAWLRRQNHRFFNKVTKVDFLNRQWFAYGNISLLELPILKPIKGHRVTKPGSDEWNHLIADCERLGEGCAGISTFMSPLEKACGEAIVSAGGSRIVLWPEGFRERWHPMREYEAYCAEGRVLFLSLYDALDHVPTKKELYERCHEMGDIVVGCL